MAEISDLRKRRGWFDVSDEMIETAPNLVQQLMGKVIVVRCEHLFAERVLRYWALSPDFAEIEEFEVTPEYDAEYDDTTASFSWSPKE